MRSPISSNRLERPRAIAATDAVLTAVHADAVSSASQTLRTAKASPALRDSFVVQRGVETTTRIPRHQAVTMWTRSADRAPSYGPCDKAWTSARHLPTPCPHSALSRPHPHRFCNSDSCERQRHRLRPVSGLLRHPRKSVYGIHRPINAVIPRGMRETTTLPEARKKLISLKCSFTLDGRLDRALSHAQVRPSRTGVSCLGRGRGTSPGPSRSRR